MTESDWLSDSDADRLLSFAAGFGSGRKIRLCLAAGLRAVAAHLEAQVGTSELRAVLRAADATERYADGMLTWDELAAEEAIAGYAVKDWLPGPESRSTDSDEGWAYFQALEAHEAAEWALALDSVEGGLRRIVDECGYRLDWPEAPLAVKVRDVFGNPFHLVTFDPRWRTADVVGVAQGIYEDRAFSRLPILADALTDADCEDEQIIGHCRSEGPHVRGCWVVDLVLGKT